MRKYYIDHDGEKRSLTREVLRRWTDNRFCITREVYWVKNTHICSKSEWSLMYYGKMSLDILWDYLERGLKDNDLKWI